MAKPYIAILDTETANWSDDVDGGFSNIPAFGLSVLGYILTTGDYTKEFAFTPDADIIARGYDFFSVPNIETAQRHLDRASLLVSFNGLGFDYKVLDSAGFKVKDWRIKSYDLMKEFKDAQGHRISLNALTEANIEKTKTFPAELVVSLWQSAKHLIELNAKPPFRRRAEQAAEFCLKNAVEYCLDDVRNTFKLFREIQLSEGRLKYPGKTGQLRWTDLRMPIGDPSVGLERQQ